ncbi:MAG: hypothetical protein HXX17_08185 [Geobacteraceae bacterium]|nr:hypothetical protein [Geobacteraceae bacterium]
MYPGGGKGGSSAPAPDPRLVQAQVESMGYQNKAIQQMMDNNADMAPLQKQQMQFGLDSAKTAYDQSQQDRTYALGKRDQLSGLQDTVVQQAKDFNEGDRASTLTNQAREGVANSYAQGQGMTNRALAARGISANSGAAIAALNGNGLNQSMNSAAAANMARDAARQEGYQLTDRASNALSGYPSMGMSATGSGATYGGAGLGYANSALTGLNSGQTAAGGMAGNMGQNATSMYGAQASYKNSQDQIAANNNPFNSVLGAATGVGMSYAMGGLQPQSFSGIGYGGVSPKTRN